MMFDTPLQFAASVAYLGSVEKIIKHTEYQFGRGRAPSPDKIAGILKAREMPELIGSTEPDTNDALQFAPRGLVPKMPAKPKYQPVMVATLPVGPIEADLSIPGELAMVIAKAFEVSTTAMLGHSRDTQVVAARSVFIRILRERGQSLKQIATRINRNDHTTVTHALNSYDARAKRFPDMDRVYRELKAMGA